MKCFQHPDVDGVGVCTSCGKVLCQSCAVEFQGRMHCKECVKKAAPAPPVPARPGGGAVRLSKGFYLSSIIVGIVGGYILLLIGLVPIMLEAQKFRPNLGLLGFFGLVLAVGFLLVIYGAVVYFVLVYKMWKAIQDGHARTTPGKAVGFLFIPFFSLYWIFQAFWGFAKDCNQYIVRHNATVPRLPEGLFLAYCILMVASGLPYIGLVIFVPGFIIGVILVAKICDTVNRLPQPSAPSAATAPGQNPPLAPG